MTLKYRVVERFRGKYAVEDMCAVFEVSRSGYYSTKQQVEQLVAEYIHFYNYERINLKDGLTPIEIRSKAA